MSAWKVQHIRAQPAVWPTDLIWLTLHSPRTHTLCGSLYEQRVPSSTVVCMKTTSRVSLAWQCRWQRLLAGEERQRTQQLNNPCVISFYILNEACMCQHDAVFYCVCLYDSYYNYESLQRLKLAVKVCDDQRASLIVYLWYTNKDTSRMVCKGSWQRFDDHILSKRTSWSKHLDHHQPAGWAVRTSYVS